MASAYFQRTENIAGVKDMRHQELVRSRLCDSHDPCAHKTASDRRCPTFSTGSGSRRLTTCISALEYLWRGPNGKLTRWDTLADDLDVGHEVQRDRGQRHQDQPSLRE